MILEHFLRFNSLLKRVTEKVFCRIEGTYSKIFPIFLQSAFKSTDNFKFAIAERLYINFRSLHQVSSYYLQNIYIRIITALFLCKISPKRDFNRNKAFIISWHEFHRFSWWFKCRLTLQAPAPAGPPPWQTLGGGAAAPAPYCWSFLLHLPPYFLCSLCTDSYVYSNFQN